MIDTYLVNAVDIAKDKAKYDAFSTRILSNKQILAHIVRGAVKEFEGFSIAQIVNCIEGNPEINLVPVDPGSTNAAIIGDNTADKVPYEGTVCFDIRFRIVTPTKERVSLIINVEAQKNFYPGYDLVTRGVYYGARLISSQKDREFEGRHYDDIKKVYSIWVCMNAPKYLQNTVTEYNIQQHKIYGNYSGKVRYDLMSVIMLCLGNPDDCIGDEDKAAKLLRLLSVVVSEELTPVQKLHILQEEYHIEVTRDLENEVNTVKESKGQPQNGALQ